MSNLPKYIEKAEKYARQAKIDPLRHIAESTVYVYHGQHDSVVSVGKKYQFFIKKIALKSKVSVLFVSFISDFLSHNIALPRPHTQIYISIKYIKLNNSVIKKLYIYFFV